MNRIARIMRRVAVGGALSVVLVALLGGTPAFASSSLPYYHVFTNGNGTGWISADTRGNFDIYAPSCVTLGAVFDCQVGHGYLHETSANHYKIDVCDDKADGIGPYVQPGTVSKIGGSGNGKCSPGTYNNTLFTWTITWDGWSTGSLNAPTIIDTGGYDSSQLD